MTPAEIGAASDVVVAIVATVALIFAWQQVRASREVSALAAYENYHLTALQYPSFGSGHFNFRNASPEQLDCYTVFVSYTLMTGERITAMFPRDKSWADAIRDDIRIHRDFIRSDLFEPYRKNQTPRMSRLIDEVLAEPPPAAPTVRRTRRPAPGPRMLPGRSGR